MMIVTIHATILMCELVNLIEIIMCNIRTGCDKRTDAARCQVQSLRTRLIAPPSPLSGKNGGLVFIDWVNPKVVFKGHYCTLSCYAFTSLVPQLHNRIWEGMFMFMYRRGDFIVSKSI